MVRENRTLQMGRIGTVHRLISDAKLVWPEAFQRYKEAITGIQQCSDLPSGVTDFSKNLLEWALTGAREKIMKNGIKKEKQKREEKEKKRKRKMEEDKALICFSLLFIYIYIYIYMLFIAHSLRL